jgi:hypothetical protein
MDSSVVPPGFPTQRVAVPANPSLPKPSPAPVFLRSARSHPSALRALLIVGCALSIGAAALLAEPSGYLQNDPALARLLRGMALIKGVAVLGAVLAVHWRFGWRVTKPLAITYLLGSWTLAGTTMLIWQLSSIVVAAVAFHTALLATLLAAWRDKTG